MEKNIQRLFVIVLIFVMSNFSFGTLTITKKVNRQAASLGSNLSYNIYLANSGPSDVTGVIVWDTIPNRTTFTGATGSGTTVGPQCQWTIGTITAGSAVSLTMTVVVDADINTITANLKNIASVFSNEEGVKDSFPVFTTIVKTFTESDSFVTYGAWEDFLRKNMGFIHIYALADNTLATLTSTDTESVTMANATIINGTPVNAGEVIDFPNANPVFNYQTGDCAEFAGLNEVALHPTNTRYFKLVTNKPILWVFDSPIDDLWSDSMIYSFSTDYKFTGSTFYAHLYRDSNPWSSSSHQNSKNFGDSIGVMNINNFDIAAYVYFSNDNGATWSLAVTNTVKAETNIGGAGNGGIWVWGGTTALTEGDYKVILRQIDTLGNDVDDAKGLLWKGNIFAASGRPCTDCSGGTPCSIGDRSSDHDNCNTFLVSQDGNKISRANSDVLFGCMATSYDSAAPNGRGEIVITNVGTAANYSIYRYRSSSSALRDPVPIPGQAFGNNGTWELWYNNLPLAAGASQTLYNFDTTKAEYGSFIKIILNSGGPIQAIGGANILAAHYGQADYLEAVDTGMGVGTDFWFGNSNYAVSHSYGAKADWWKDNRGGIFVALCPQPNTKVSIVSGNLVDLWATDYGTNGNNDWNGQIYHGVSAAIQTTGAGPDQALKFYSINTGQTYHITSDKKIYLMVQNLKGREKLFSGMVVAAQYLSPNPILSKSASSSAVNTGDNFTWTLNFFNNGAGSAKNVRVYDTLPVGVSFLSSVPTTSSIVGNYYTWDFSSVAPNSSAVIKMIVKATACGFNVTNTAATYYEDNINAPQPILFSQDSAITINCIPTATNTYTNTATPTATPTNTATPIIPQFSIVKAVAPSSAGIGETITYTISCVNTNNIALTNFEIWDTIPSQLENISNITIPGIYNSITGVIRWSIVSAIPIGGSVNLAFTATLKDSVTRNEVIENMASANALSATAAVDSNKANVTADVPLLQLKPVTNYPNPFDGETTIVYTLTVAAKCKISFYTISGEKVGEIANIAGQSGTNKQIWYGLNKANKKLSSGVYIYRIDAVRGDEKQHCLSRLAIIR